MRTISTTHLKNDQAASFNIGNYFSVSKKQISFQNADPLKQDQKCENEVHCLIAECHFFDDLGIQRNLVYGFGSVFQIQWASLSHFLLCLSKI